MNVVRVVYKNADGQDCVAMIEDAPHKVLRRVYMEGGVREMCLVQRDVLGVVHKGESVDHTAVPMPGVDQVFKMATKVSGLILEKVYSNGARDEEIDRWGQELSKGCAEAYTIAMAARLPKFPDIAGPEGDGENPEGDPTDAGQPRKKSSYRQPGAEDVEHLDESRMREIGKKPGPATVYDGASRSLIARGWERVEDSPDEFEHWTKDETGEVIIGPEGFVVKSAWDGSLSGSEDFADLEEALDNIVG